MADETSKEGRLRRVEADESVANRLRNRFGVGEGNPDVERVRDWMTSQGAVPVTLACVALAVYLVIAFISELLSLQ